MYFNSGKNISFVGSCCKGTGEAKRINDQVWSNTETVNKLAKNPYRQNVVSSQNLGIRKVGSITGFNLGSKIRL